MSYEPFFDDGNVLYDSRRDEEYGQRDEDYLYDKAVRPTACIVADDDEKQALYYSAYIAHCLDRVRVDVYVISQDPFDSDDNYVQK